MKRFLAILVIFVGFAINANAQSVKKVALDSLKK